jgi:hypothetical protein
MYAYSICNARRQLLLDKQAVAAQQQKAEAAAQQDQQAAAAEPAAVSNSPGGAPWGGILALLEKLEKAGQLQSVAWASSDTTHYKKNAVKCRINNFAAEVRCAVIEAAMPFARKVEEDNAASTQTPAEPEQVYPELRQRITDIVSAAVVAPGNTTDATGHRPSPARGECRLQPVVCLTCAASLVTPAW